MVSPAKGDVRPNPTWISSKAQSADRQNKTCLKKKKKQKQILLKYEYLLKIMFEIIKIFPCNFFQEQQLVDKQKEKKMSSFIQILGTTNQEQ